jgi:NADH-quinone oxidoreductase subunit K
MRAAARSPNPQRTAVPDYGQFDFAGGTLDVRWFLLVAAILFILGTIGVLVRHHPIIILVCIELMLNAVNLTLIAFARELHNLEGQLFALMTMVVAAAEAVVGLAVLVDIVHFRDVEDVDELSELRG